MITTCSHLEVLASRPLSVTWVTTKVRAVMGMKELRDDSAFSQASERTSILKKTTVVAL
jgi:hypothetical protein